MEEEEDGRDTSGQSLGETLNRQARPHVLRLLLLLALAIREGYYMYKILKEIDEDVKRLRGELHVWVNDGMSAYVCSGLLVLLPPVFEKQSDPRIMRKSPISHHRAAASAAWHGNQPLTWWADDAQHSRPRGVWGRPLFLTVTYQS